jgi:hypothetical protein
MRQHLKDIGKWVASGPLLGIVGIVLTLAVASHDQMPLLAMCVIGIAAFATVTPPNTPVRVVCGLVAGTAVLASAVVVYLNPQLLHPAPVKNTSAPAEPKLPPVVIIDPNPKVDTPHNGCLTMTFNAENMPPNWTFITSTQQVGVQRIYFEGTVDHSDPKSSLWQGRMWLGYPDHGMGEKFTVSVIAIPVDLAQYLSIDMKEDPTASSAWSATKNPPGSQVVATATVTRDSNPKLNPPCQ